MTMNVKYNTMNVKLGQTLGGVEGQGGLACCSPGGCKDSDTTGRLNNNNKNIASYDKAND